MFCWKTSRLIDYYYPRFSMFGSFLSFLLVHFFDKQASSSTQTRIYILQNSKKKKIEMKRKGKKNKGIIIGNLWRGIVNCISIYGTSLLEKDGQFLYHILFILTWNKKHFLQNLEQFCFLINCVLLWREHT